MEFFTCFVEKLPRSTGGVFVHQHVVDRGDLPGDFYESPAVDPGCWWHLYKDESPEIYPSIFLRTENFCDGSGWTRSAPTKWEPKASILMSGEESSRSVTDEYLSHWFLFEDHPKKNPSAFKSLNKTDLLENSSQASCMFGH